MINKIFVMNIDERLMKLRCSVISNRRINSRMKYSFTYEKKNLNCFIEEFQTFFPLEFFL